MKYTLIQVINEEVKILKENATIEDFNKEKVELEKTYKKEIIDDLEYGECKLANVLQVKSGYQLETKDKMIILELKNSEAINF